MRDRIRSFRNAGIGAYRSMRDLTDREKKFLLSEILQIKGLMPLLMKPRNKQRWTAEDRAELRIHLRRLSNLSPYFVVLALPGSFLLLPMLAWWLDRRRNRKQPPHSGVPRIVEGPAEHPGASGAGGGIAFSCYPAS